MCAWRPRRGRARKVRQNTTLRLSAFCFRFFLLFFFVARVKRSETRERLRSGTGDPGFRFAPSGLHFAKVLTARIEAGTTPAWSFALRLRASRDGACYSSDAEKRIARTAHYCEPTGPARSGRPDDKLREAIQSEVRPWIASSRSLVAVTNQLKGSVFALTQNRRSGRTRPVRRAASENCWRRDCGRRNRSTPRKTASAPAAFSRTDRQCDACAPTIPEHRCRDRDR